MGKGLKIKEVCEIIGGYAFKSTKFTNKGVPIIRIGDISANKVSVSSNTVYIDENIENYKKFVIYKGDILIALSGATTGKFGIYNEDKVALLNQRLAKISPKDDISNRYLYHYMNKLKDIIYSKALGCAQPNISPKEIGEINIFIPSINEQNKVVDILDQCQSLIYKRKAQMEALDELVKSRFIEMFGDTIMNPKEYQTNCLKSLADIVSGITKGRKTNNKELFQVPYMRVANVKDGYIDWSEIKTIDATNEEIERYRLLDDDVLMTEGGDADKLGRGSILYNPPNNCIHQNHIFRVRLNKDMINPVYFSEYLKHPLVKLYFLRSAKQTTGIASINMTQLKKAPILLPPIELQNQFADFVKQIDKLKFEMKNSLKELEDNFNSLMQKAFNGELFN
ncbi:hypothetical protein N452_03420 [Clostridium botulinum A2 117]|uniref:restriction endonuclease subunit S n=1 Tax=Clostridium botulinum TaxID=1491 RepID=UPI0007E04EB6|nr:restriction endonuclease subunit S [Clostridium botulinum]KEI77708.1 hypothetical protein N452_03420 [Clostridium botulinum A2 117]MBN3414874.1 hypothetical protein [Clostridium botulinum]MBN3441167.1 hypothetical protein [Clostridium botulinum]MBY6807709.1 restriction endonuclease subunit S [Clostridium botulinum]